MGAFGELREVAVLGALYEGFSRLSAFGQAEEDCEDGAAPGEADMLKRGQRSRVLACEVVNGDPGSFLKKQVDREEKLVWIFRVERFAECARIRGLGEIIGQGVDLFRFKSDPADDLNQALLKRASTAALVLR